MPETSAQSASAPARDPAFDLARGFAILSVLVHHWSSYSARLYTQPKAWDWWLLTCINRMTIYTVPTFLLLSCVLAARKLAKNSNAIEFYKARLPGVIYPYLVWTVVFWGMTLLANPAARALHNGIPDFFTHGKARLNDLIWGKASYHLYFLSVLIQMLIFMPLLFWRPIRSCWESLIGKPGAMIGVWIVIQLGVLALQHYFLRVPYPASTFFWFPSAWWFSLHLAAEMGKEPVANSSARKALNLVGWLLVVGAYATLSLWILTGHAVAPGDWVSENLMAALYTGVIALTVYRLARRARQPYKSPTMPWLEYLGKNSLQIYLIHPIVLEVLARHRIHSVLVQTRIGPAVVIALLLGITLGISELIKRLKLGTILYGRAV